MSTPSDSPNCRSSMSFGVIADAAAATPGALIPLCSPISPPSTTVVSISAPSVESHAQLDEAVGEQQPVAGPDAPAPAPRMSSTAGRARRRSRRWRSSAGRPACDAGSAGRRSQRPRCGFSARRGPEGSPLRAARRDAAARMRSNVAACDSCVPCEKFRRKMSVPAAISASSIASESLAGPTVAMIFVWRIFTSTRIPRWV